MTDRLTDSEIGARMADVPDWGREGDAISRTVRFDTFADGIDFICRVAPVADDADHHPDIDIRYRNVKFLLTSHDSGGITDRDFTMAAKINGLLAG